MKEFDYSLDYKELDFTNERTRHLYRIGRGEQGVLLVRPYTTELVASWRFKTLQEAEHSSKAIYEKFETYLNQGDFIGADIARKFLEMGFTRSRRYANHPSGKKYNVDGSLRPQATDHATSHFAESARVFKTRRDRAIKHPVYVKLRKEWRDAE